MGAAHRLSARRWTQASRALIAQRWRATPSRLRSLDDDAVSITLVRLPDAACAAPPCAVLRHGVCHAAPRGRTPVPLVCSGGVALLAAAACADMLIACSLCETCVLATFVCTCTHSALCLCSVGCTMWGTAIRRENGNARCCLGCSPFFGACVLLLIACSSAATDGTPFWRLSMSNTTFRPRWCVQSRTVHACPRQSAKWHRPSPMHFCVRSFSFFSHTMSRMWTMRSASAASVVSLSCVFCHIACLYSGAVETTEHIRRNSRPAWVLGSC
jgi:hypothetical protein